MGIFLEIIEWTDTLTSRMLNSGFLDTGEFGPQPVKMVVSDIENKTDLSHFPNDILLGNIRAAMLESGKARFVTTYGDQGTDEMTRDTQDLKNDPLFDSSQVPEQGQATVARLSLRTQILWVRSQGTKQAQNTYDAVTYLETVDGVDRDRIGVYGSSFGGANAIWSAAFDPRMKVVVSAVGVTNGERWLRSVRSAYDWFGFRDHVHADARQRVRSGEKTMIYRYDIYPTDPDAVDKPTMTVEEHGAEDVTHVDMESVEACFRYKPDWVVDRISPRPVLFVAAEYDSIVPPEEIVATYERCGEPKKLVWLPDARHNQVYEFSDSEHFETVASEVTEWFREYL